ncbi:MAG: RNA polymerase sigma factor [bacterium]|nr:RNA polymerase sigma factor [bacterium]
MEHSEQEEWLAAARDGDQSALQQLLLSNFDQLAEHISRRIPDSVRPVVDVEDILQMTFIEVFRSFSKFHAGDAKAFFAWLRVVANARAADAIRRAGRKKRGGDWKRGDCHVLGSRESYKRLIDLISDHKRSPSRMAAANEAVAALQVALDSLPVDQGEAIRLRYIENLNTDEVAQKMRLSSGAVRGLLHRGKKSLRKLLGNASDWISRTQ